MVELLLTYYKDTVIFNASFSAIVGVLGMVNSFIDAFSFSFLTGGFLISIFFYNLKRKKEYYFYYNRGLTKLHLCLGCLVINIIFVSFLYTFQFDQMRKDILEVEGIIYGFGSAKLLTYVYLKCGTGDIVAILGRNGCGKSSLIK